MVSPSLLGPRTPLIGRDREVQAVGTLLKCDEIQLVTLLGPGGVGKTRLARSVAASVAGQFRDGVAFVSLEQIRSPDLVLPAIARAIGLGESSPNTALDDLIAALSTKWLLLLLDNAEHVIDAAVQVAQLLAASPRVTVLVTSREPLRLSIEHEFWVAPLPLPSGSTTAALDEIAASPAVRLFAERARAVQPDFAVTPANAWDVASVCRRLDGLPLAIELAAARSKVLSPHALLTHLDTALPILVGGPRDAPARQHTMRDTVHWSYELLGPNNQRLFRLLAVFVGGFTLDAATRIARDGGDHGVTVLDGITSLVDRSLVVPVPDAAEPRFTMLETIREYALERLVDAGEENDAQRAHAEYFRDLAEQAEPELRGAGQPAWIARLETELPNLRAVLDWSLAGGDVETGFRLAGALFWFWFLRNHVREGRAWYERARASGRRPAAAAGRAALGAAMLAWRVADYVASEAYCQDALAAFRVCGDRWGMAMVVHHLGHIADDLNHDLVRASTLLTDSLDKFAAIGDDWGVAFSRRCLARLRAERSQDFAGAAPLLEAAVSTFRRIGDRWNLGVTLHMLADNARERGEWAAAIPFYQEGLVNHWEDRDPLGVADALLRLAQIQVELGEAEMATRFFGFAEAQHQQAEVRIYEPIRASYEQTVEAARVALGPERFAAAWQEGRAMTLEEAMAHALAVKSPIVSPAHTAGRPEHARPGPALSDRQRQVLRLLVEGRSDGEIAETLHIGRRTVHTHVAAILDRLGVSSRTAAATRAVRDGLV